jgi:hypothetical protein
MNKTETQEILRQVAVVDNRKVSADTLEAWHSIIGRIPFDIAKEALKLAQQDATIKYLRASAHCRLGKRGSVPARSRKAKARARTVRKSRATNLQAPNPCDEVQPLLS